MNANIFDIQRFSVHDGPGIRTTVFFSGCSLCCAWCHNPEGLQNTPRLQWTRADCIGCGLCGDRASLSDAARCPSGALHICGREADVEELYEAVLRDRDFYGEDGGVTCSGGECLLQADAVAALLSRVKTAGLHTAIDTAGNVPWSAFAKTMDVCDVYLYDIKCADPARHKAFCGDGNTRILDNLTRLSRTGAEIHLRVPVIPGFNDTEDEMTAIADIAAGVKNAVGVTLIPYHTLGAPKYESLGMAYPMPDAKPPKQIQMDTFRAIFEARGIRVL